MPRSRRPISKEALYTVAPLAIATGLAVAAHGGWLCSGSEANPSQVQIIAKAEKGTTLDVEADGVKVRVKRGKKRRAKGVADVDPLRLGSKIYRATETHWVPRAVVRKVYADPSLLAMYGDFAPVRECGGLVGYRLVDTMKHGLFRKLGFKDGDLITAVDGQPIRSLSDAAEAAVDVEHADQLTVTVVRHGKTLQKKFLVE